MRPYNAPVQCARPVRPWKPPNLVPDSGMNSFGGQVACGIRWGMFYNPKTYTRKNTLRCKGWNYSGPGRYFITISVHQHAHVFGHISDGHMNHSEIGSIARDCWADIPNHYPNVRLGDFVIMPNHMHGILMLDGDDRFRTNPSATSHIVRMYKSIVTKRSLSVLPTFRWMRNYHDIIIRDDRAFRVITTYIRNNPKNWNRDRFRKRVRTR